MDHRQPGRSCTLVPTSAIPCFLEETGLDIAGIVHKNVQCTVNSDGFFDFGIEFGLGSSDVKIKYPSASIFGVLKALSSISSSGYHSITSCDDGRDEVFSDSRGAARHKPSKLRHDGGEVKDERKVVNVTADTDVWGKRIVKDWSRCTLGVTIRYDKYGICFGCYGVNYRKWCIYRSCSMKDLHVFRF